MASENLKSVVAKHKARDNEGHFIKSEFLGEHTSYSKNQDDLLDVRVRNPLQKIVVLLGEIKKQKAFSFTLKGSLGIAGVALALGVFGVFGGGKILCDRGVQSEIGVIKTLSIYQIENLTVPVLSNILDFFNPKTSHQRIVLVKDNNTIINLPFVKNVDLFKFNNTLVIATGNYDSCGQTLTIKDQVSIETFAR